MGDRDDLVGKKILIVDDESDILSTLKGLLTDCVVDTALDFETALELLEKNAYDAAILDIMGVKGYDLLDIAVKKGIPTLMLTAHALTPENFVISIKRGALAYIPKDRITEIEIFLIDILEAQEEGRKRPGKWFGRLEPYFEEKFGTDWKKRPDPEFWKRYFYI